MLRACRQRAKQRTGWKRVKIGLGKAEKELAAARDLVKGTKDRGGAEIELLAEELDDIASRFDSLKRRLDSQSGPAVEEEGDSGSAEKEDDG